MSSLKRSITNTIWLFGEKIITMGLTIVTSIVLARYLSKTEFGLINYLISFLGLLAPFSALGLNGIVTRELVFGKKSEEEILGSALFLRVAGGIAAIIVCVFLIIIGLDFEISDSWIVFASLANVFTSILVLDYYFQSQTKSKYVVRCRLTILVLSSFFKIGVIFTGNSYEYVMIMILAEPVLLSILLFISYRSYIGKSIKMTVNYSYAKELISQSKWLVMSGFMAVVYLKIDQIMLAKLASLEDVAIYSVASRLSEVWYFFPVAFVSSFFPRLLKNRENKEKYIGQLQSLCDLLFFSALILSLVVTVVGDYVIELLYGISYIESAFVLKVHIWSSVFIFMRALLSKWLIAEGMLKFSLVTHGIAAVLNVVMNTFLIPEYKSSGAAVATLLSYASASYFVLWFSKETRPMAVIMTKSIIFISTYKTLVKCFKKGSI
ncbi:flippase [Vibrio litoralis]|uniref:flippase n=1 Tax=Vibrio litoralis TaxID=335972 RepID=UPI001866AEF7|nr:flippase [Vibrio litoralis]